LFVSRALGGRGLADAGGPASPAQIGDGSKFPRSGAGAGSTMRGGTGGTSSAGRSIGAAARAVDARRGKKPAASREPNRLNMCAFDLTVFPDHCSAYHPRLLTASYHPVRPRIAGQAPVQSPAGRDSVNLVPLRESTALRLSPSCNWTMRNTIDNPMPLPFSLVVKYRSKMRADSGWNADAGVLDHEGDPAPRRRRRHDEAKRAALRHRCSALMARFRTACISMP
jgi:hypothetical protein